jgi:hypothetical protein
MLNNTRLADVFNQGKRRNTPTKDQTSSAAILTANSTKPTPKGVGSSFGDFLKMQAHFDRFSGRTSVVESLLLTPLADFGKKASNIWVESVLVYVYNESTKQGECLQQQECTIEPQAKGIANIRQNLHAGVPIYHDRKSLV